MAERAFQSLSGQVAETLKAGMLNGRWRGALPGRHRLAAELGVSHRTVGEATRRLEREGWLVSQGSGRRCRIVLPKGERPRRKLRVRILPYDRESRLLPYVLDMIDLLRMEGFAVDYSLKTLADLGMDAARVARFVAKTPADAWVVMSGSREVLEWFSKGDVPALALFGRALGLPIAATGPRMAPAVLVAVRRLVALGHRRIVMMSREERRQPYPAAIEQLFLDELNAHGIATGGYHLPDWEDTADGFRERLDTLFLHTPPTALIFGEVRLFTAAQQHLARRGIHAPEDISLISGGTDPSLSWCKPTVSFFSWDTQPVIKRVVRWVKNVADGNEDRRQVLFEGGFVEGGTMGPVAGRRSGSV